MGDMSFLRFVPSSSATVPIDWTKVPEASKKYLLEGWGIDYSAEMDDESDSDSEEAKGPPSESSSDSEEEFPPIKRRPLPATIDDLAKMLHESKFFGYMGPEHCTLLLDISEFGLAEPRGTETRFHVGPRFYMRYLSKIWFVLFVPGSRGAITGNSPEIPYTESAYDDAGIARDKALAEEYDVKLCEEVGRLGTAGAIALKKVAGWEASTLKSSMQLAQMLDATMKLPTNHPAHVAMVQGFSSYLSQ